MQQMNQTAESKILKTRSYRYLILLCACLAYFFCVFPRVSPAVMAGSISKAFKVGPAILGLFASLYFYPYGIAQLVAGFLADWWGSRNSMSVFLIIAGLGSLVSGISPVLSGLLVGRFLIGVGFAFVFVPSVRLITDWFKKDQFATAIGIFQSVGFLGGVAAASPLVALMTAVGWRGAFYVLGIISIVLAILIYLVVRNKPHEVGGADIEEIEDASEKRISVGMAEGIKITFKSYNYWVTTALFFVTAGASLGFGGIWGGPYLANVYAMSKAQVGMNVSLIAIGMFIGALVFGRCADTVIRNKKILVLIAGIINIIFWIILISHTATLSPHAISVLYFAFGFAGGAIPVLWTITKESVNVAIVGTSVGISNFLQFGIAVSLFQQIMGIIIGKAPVVHGVISASGFRSAFIFCGVCYAVGLCIFLTLKRAGSKEAEGLTQAQGTTA